MTLDEFNSLSKDAATELLLGCCHSEGWAREVAAGRPFANLAALEARADRLWAQAPEAELLEAFAAHPLIGDVELLRRKFAGRAHSEQGQVLEASDGTLQALARLNQVYLDRFGFIFIICATGKSADEMLQHLRTRLENTRADEIRNAAEEQAKITALRLAQTITDQRS